MQTDEQRGLDETRRLLLVAYVRKYRGEPVGAELCGTIINSLRYHHPNLFVTGGLIPIEQSLLVEESMNTAPIETAIAAICRQLGDSR